MRLNALAVCLLMTSFRLSMQQSLPTAWTQGIATNYGGAQDGMDPSKASYGTKDGSCGYGSVSSSSYPYWSVAALSTSNKYSLAGPSQGCGQCFEIQCVNSGGQFAGKCSSSQSITVTITDSCPECEPDHIDIQALSFNKIAPMAVGRINMQYRRVDCTPPETVSVAIDNNSGVGGWLRLVVEKTAGFGGITLVQMRTSGQGSWLSLRNSFGSTWEIANTPSLPWDFQFTSDSKQAVQAMSLVNQNGKVGSIPTGVQFSLSGSTGNTNINYDAASPPSPPAANTNALASQTASSTPAGTTAAASPPVGTQQAASSTPTSTSQATTAGTTQNAAQTTTASACCSDNNPGGGATCQQQSAWGKCSADWMVAGGFCQLTCGRCPASCSGQSSSTTSSSTSVPTGTPAQGSQQTTSPAPPTSTSSTPASTSSSTPASTAGQTCDDIPVPSIQQSCSQLATNGQCSSVVPAANCRKSCGRC